MQAVLLAAGMGKRLRNYTEDNTKCMVKVNGKRIIDSLFESILMANAGKKVIDRIIIVIGYEGGKLKSYLDDRYSDADIEIKYIENPDYSTTNNIYSLWLASDYLKQDDTILLESDILYEIGLIKDLVEDKRKDLVVIDKFLHFMDGTMILLDENDSIMSFIPKSEFLYEKADEYYKTVNIYKFSVEFLKKYYLPFLDAYIKSFGNNEYYEQVLRVLSFLPGTGLHGFKMNGRKWYEIDNAADLDIASQIFAGNEEKTTDLASRYGGYWRFSEVLDFCYLVNPYFPDTAFVDEMKYMFDDLLRNYPSGLKIQNLLASEVFECSPEHILTGNGAAELIKSLLEVIEGKVGIIFPSFNEYAERIQGEAVPFFPPNTDDFRYKAEDIIGWSENVDNFVLINPDNPSGNYIEKNELLKLADHFEKKSKRLIVDESFLDFADQEDTNGLISDSILNRFPHMVVVKSISKSYGVPGLRLGVLVSSDIEFLAEIKKRLSIWNINSFAEFFLQIYTKHSAQYKLSCHKIALERELFFKKLAELSFIRPIPSKANYILCELRGINAGVLQGRLLEDYSIFIKDLNGKKGIPEDREFIRIAVRDRVDNERLLEALSKIEKTIR